MVKKKKLFLKLLFVAGFLICIYPLIGSMISHIQQSSQIQTYESSMKKVDPEWEQIQLDKAKEYNEVLYQTQGAYIQNVSDILSDESYASMLNWTQTDVMGRIMIPKISVDLPIYHGTDEKELSKGVGHIQSSSLPVGGNNTRCILSAHRGLPNSKLFTRLDEIELKDLFYIEIGSQTLAYRVCDIQVIDPEDESSLSIEPDQDLVSLVTCTPYGLNTHRLVVTGKRVPYEKKEKDAIQPKWMSWRELIFTILPFCFVIFAVVRWMNHRRKETKNELDQKN